MASVRGYPDVSGDMGIFPYLTFTRLLRDGSREALGRYAEDLTSAIADWEGVAAAAVKLRPSDPLQAWCPPVEDGVPGKGRRPAAGRTVSCRVPARDVVRRWWLSLEVAGAPRVHGSLFADDPSDHLDEAADLRGYGDHLLRNALADTTDNLDDAAAGGYTRGGRTGIYLVTRLEALPDGLLPSFRVSATPPTGALVRAVEETLGGDSPGREILTVTGRHREVRRFLHRCDIELLERWGVARFSRLLEPLGVTLKQWRQAF